MNKELTIGQKILIGVLAGALVGAFSAFVQHHVTKQVAQKKLG